MSRTCYLFILLQVFQFFIVVHIFQGRYYTEEISKCDCKCPQISHLVKQVIRDEPKQEKVKDQKINKIVNSEKSLQNLLNVEDRELDKEWKKQMETEEKLDLVGDDENERDETSGSPLDPTQHIYKMAYKTLNINPEISGENSKCAGNYSDTIVVYVYTAPQNLENRLRIRKTWGSVKEYLKIKFKVIFFIGELSPSTANEYSRILKESETYGDIVQDRSYIDAYKNLTLKGLSALQWINEHCLHAYRIIKADDDTLINPFRLIKFLTTQSQITMGEIICKTTEHVGPIRKSSSKYYVSKEEFPGDVYPNYCQGYGYIIPPNIIPKILEVAPFHSLLTMEDVYFTGILREAISIRLHPLTASYSTTFHKYVTFLERITARQHLLTIGHVHDNQAANVFWQLITQRFNFNPPKV